MLKMDNYKNANTFIKNQTDLPEVIHYDIISNQDSYKALSGLEDYSYYDVRIKITFADVNPILNVEEYTTTVTLIEKIKDLVLFAIGRIING